jgi:ribonuclease P protein component
MLPRQLRLTKKDALSGILRTGGTATSRSIVARFRKNDRQNPRFSVIVSKKIEKNATDRNRLRRQLYEIIRLHQDKFTATPYFDILILPKKAMIGATYQEIEQDFLKILPHIQ